MQGSNGVNKKHLIAQRSLWLFMAKLMPTIVFILITILYSRQLSYYNYGLFQSVWMYTNVISVTISFGIYSLLLSSDLSSFYSLFKNYKKNITAFYLALVTLTFLTFLFTEKNMEYSIRFLLIFFILIQTATLILEVLLIKTGQEKFIFFSNSFYSLVFFGWHYYVLQKSFDLQFLLIGIIILSTLKLFLFSLKIKKIPVGQPNTKVSFNQWKFLGLNDIVGVFAKWIDKLVLIYLLSPGNFALFFNGSIEIPMFGIMISVIGSIMLVEIATKLYSNKQVAEIFRESFLMLSCITFPVFWFLLFYRNELFFIAFEHKYDASIPIFFITLMILPLRINNYSVILQCYDKANEVLKGSVLDILIAVALMPVLYHFIGLRGIALSIVISTFFQLFYYLKQSAKVLSIPVLQLIPLKSLIIFFILTSLISLFLFLALQDLNVYFRLTVAITLTLLLTATSLFYHFKRENFLKRRINSFF